jgi:hypothetical protein
LRAKRSGARQLQRGVGPQLNGHKRRLEFLKQIPFILCNYNAVTIMDVVRISSKDRQYKKSNNQEWTEKTALLQELIEVMPDKELSKNPYKEGDERPWPQLCKETQNAAGLPGQRRVDPGSDHTGDDSNHWGEQTSSNEEQCDRQQDQDDTAIFPLNKGRRPDHGYEADNGRQDARYQKTGNDGHGGFAKVPHFFRLARRAYGSDYEAVWPDIALKYFKVTVFWTTKSGKKAK